MAVTCGAPCLHCLQDISTCIQLRMSVLQLLLQDSLTQHMALTETVLKQKQDLAAAVDKRAQLRQHLRACNNVRH